MSSKLRLLIGPEAQIEIEKIIEYYEASQANLGLEFFHYLEGYFKTLEQGEALFQIKRKPTFRELVLKRFPYVIIYEQTDTEVYVYSVFNTYQNPLNKKR